MVGRPSAHAGPQHSVRHAVEGVPVPVPPAAQEAKAVQENEEKETAAFARSDVVESIFRLREKELRVAS